MIVSQFSIIVTNACAHLMQSKGFGSDSRFASGYFGLESEHHYSG